MPSQRPKPRMKYYFRTQQQFILHPICDMLRSDRKRKQPESFYRLQEADYRNMKSHRMVPVAAVPRINSDEEYDDDLQKPQQQQGKVSRSSHVDSSSKGSRYTDRGGSRNKLKLDLRTTHRQSHSHHSRRVEQQQSKSCLPSGNTKLGSMAIRFVDFLQVRADRE